VQNNFIKEFKLSSNQQLIASVLEVHCRHHCHSEPFGQCLYVGGGRCPKEMRNSALIFAGMHLTAILFVAGRGVYPPTTKVLFPNFPIALPFPLPLSPPFPSFPLPLVLPSPPFPSCREAS